MGILRRKVITNVPDRKYHDVSSNGIESENVMLIEIPNTFIQTILPRNDDRE